MYKTRSIENIIMSAAAEFPAIALMGPRQVGKSTLLKELFQDKYEYISFDDIQLRQQAKKDPALFFKNHPGRLILDEIQYVPELFPEIKIRIDNKKMNGQFLITGSQQYEIMRGMKESLAGRILLLNLPGMTIYEKEGYGDYDHWLITVLKKCIVKKKDFKELAGKVTPIKEIFTGTLPGLIEKNKTFIPSYFESYIKTYVERDLNLIAGGRVPADIIRFLSLLAPQVSTELNKSELGRELGISPPTSNRWLYWLSASMIWKEDEPFNSNYIKRISKHSKGYYFDTGLACSLLRIADAGILETHPMIGNLFETAIRNEFHAVLDNYLIPAKIYHYRTIYGKEIDIIIEYNNKLFLFECKWNSTIRSNDLKNLKSFREIYPDKVAFSAVITATGNLMEIEDGIWQIPWIMK